MGAQLANWLEITVGLLALFFAIIIFIQHFFKHTEKTYCRRCHKMFERPKKLKEEELVQDNFCYECQQEILKYKEVK